MKLRSNRPLNVLGALLGLHLISAAAWGAPNGTLFQDDPVTARGFSADKVFQFGDLDHVNLFNGNLLLTIPIGSSYPVSRHLSYGLTLVYNGNLWDFEHWCEGGEPTDRCFSAAWPGPGFQAGMGWTLSMGRLLPPEVDFLNESSFWVYAGSDGGRHRFWNTLHQDETPVANVGYSRDGSYLRMTLDGGVRKVQFPDGVVQTFHDLTPGSEND
ncbi:MAG: hypothetical protein GY713_12620, partial [Actinomycetia bacterium]|nr:hypothetical protein [Actinomycetes bacterium]